MIDRLPRSAMAVLALCAAASSHSAAPRFQAAPSRIVPWTQSLRDAQSELPNLLHYQHRGASLTFVGVVHDNDPNGPSFRLIDRASRTWPPRAVIIEGFATGLGRNPPAATTLAREALDARGMQPSAETVPAVRAALAVGAGVWGGEPDDLDVKDFVSSHGVSERDLLGFYVLRVVPQWLREGILRSTQDPKLVQLVDRQLARSRADLKIAPLVLPDFAAWSAWYAGTQGKPIAAGLADDEAGPLSDGRWRTNRVSELVGRARDAHLLTLIARLLNTQGRVLVVYGGSHALVTRPALDAMLGHGCYAGANPGGATARCSSNGLEDFK